MKHLLPFLLLALLTQCGTEQVRFEERAVPSYWAELTLDIAKNTPANSPTFASRGFGYMGLAMYESVVHGAPGHRSLVGQLNGLDFLPLPQKTLRYNWVLTLNAAQAFLLKNIYQQTSDANKARIDSLEAVVFIRLGEREADEAVAHRSVRYGQAIAAAIYQWSMTDGGHRGYLRNFDSKQQLPTGPGTWKAPYFAQTISRFPLHPHWGQNRTFLKTNANWDGPPCLPFSKKQQSAYYQQFSDVYAANKALTQEQKEIAMWWNDDPTDTFTPPGHSYNLANLAVKTKQADLITAAETFARVGMAVADAFIICWRMKYVHATERPSSFITEHIDEQWEPFWPDPPFPAFPSGHATQASAVATVLTELYGPNMDIVDDTHARRPKDRIRNVSYKPRRFRSFWAIAEETAYSRFLGGIHCRHDNDVGLSEGTKVGQHINALQWASL
jgi:hypothetical protein